ncbi:heparin lyase I family protein [Zobellia alginiliquefaciens]|uniref:heparin lyase I family protein n=1 Tax=Zobellia alginiliquefaciens TaxID=3032586 RepID=UPI0023E3B5BD|nr:heparin lyase I family protein [Zobellia alginiliquefaciens]
MTYQNLYEIYENIMKVPNITILYLTVFAMISCGKDNLNLEENESVAGLQKTVEIRDSSEGNDLVASESEKASVEIECVTNGAMANELGLKTWCWEDASIPDYSEKKGVLFSNGQMKVDSECYEKQVTIEDGRVKFSLNPTFPVVEDWCSRDFNMRAEISTQPWRVDHPKGTEEWFGWSYTFGSDYIIDKNNQWLFFQVHPGIVGESPQTELMVVKEGQMNGHDAGEIFVINAANGKDYHPTGIIPTAGETFNIVVHAIWGDESNGLLQVWINEKIVYDKQVPTVYSAYPWGGNAKWGIYKWPWAEASGVEKSHDQGITHLETFMGSLKMITREPSNPDYGKDSYAIVSPK